MRSRSIHRSVWKRGGLPLVALLAGFSSLARSGELEDAAAGLRRLVAIPGVPGHEAAVRAAIRSALPGWTAPEEDNLGDLTVSLGSGSPRRLLVAHMDEPGYLVTAVTEHGYLKLQRLSTAPLPALFDQFHLGQPLVIATRRGLVPAVASVYSTHLWRGDSPPLRARVSDEDLFVDAGARSPDEVRAAGIALLDPVTIARRVVDLAGGRIAGPALDDRAGCVVLIELLKRLEPPKLKGTLTVAFAAQGMTAGRGTARLTRRFTPEEILVVDTPHLVPPSRQGGSAVAAPGAVPGGGPAIGLPSGATQPLYGRVMSVAAQAGIPLQNVLDVVPAGGDAAPATARLTLGVPLLYPGTPAQVVDTRDLLSLARLLKRVVEETP